MDAERFDNLIRALPAGDSRRRLLAAALGGILGLLAIGPSEIDAKKSCKGLKGKKKKKCLAKAKNAQCKKDADCPDQIDSCRNGRCERVCPNNACPGCAACFIQYEHDGDRVRRCAGSAEIPATLDFCNTDSNCPQAAPLCISFAEVSCLEGPCGVCAESLSSCDAPACVNDGDCQDRSQSCQSGNCQPVCPTGSCSGCNFCAVEFTASADREQVCADGFTFSDSLTCNTSADCPQGNTCIRFPTTSCTQAPCGQCVLAIDACP